MHTHEQIAIFSKGIFSSSRIPEGWLDYSQVNTEIAPLLRMIQSIEPGSEVLGVIPRSSNSRTFLLRCEGEVRVCQFGPAFSLTENENATSSEAAMSNERLNPNKFQDVEARLQHLQLWDGAVPRVIRTGTTEDDGVHRSFIEMAFLRGVPGDAFLKRHPEKVDDVFFKVGKALAHLQHIPLEAQDLKRSLATDPKTALLLRQNKLIDELFQRGVLSQSEAKTTLHATEQQLSVIPEVPVGYVHRDPFPVNWVISGSQSDLKVDFFDIEAIDIGHPLIEGIARAAQWAGVDWFAIQGNAQEIGQHLPQLLAGFNENSPENMRLSLDQLNMLMHTEELLWLPLAMHFAALSNPEDERSTQRRKENLLEIAQMEK